MKNLFSILKITAAMMVLLAVLYPIAIYGIAQLTPNFGKGETISVNGKVVGYKKIGQKFDKINYFWPRPSAVDYNAAASGGSNKGASNEEYLQVVQSRIDTFLISHPYLKKSQIPADIVTASGSGLDPHISAQAALIQVERIATVRNLPIQSVKNLVESKIVRPVFGPENVNVLELNIALNALK